jgi:hypothetical protein
MNSILCLQKIESLALQGMEESTEQLTFIKLKNKKDDVSHYSINSSGLTGVWLNLFPVASSKALTIDAGPTINAASPTPLAPLGY